MRLNSRDPIAQRCSHRRHSAVKLERRSHYPVAPAEPLLVVIGTVDGGQYIYGLFLNSNKKESNRRVIRNERNVKARQERQEADELTSRYLAR